jgi:hypothetical protein
MPPAKDAGAILAAFPGPVTLYPSRKKWLVLLAAGIAFTAAGIGMIHEHVSMGWPIVLLFGAGILISLVVLLPGASGLKLDRNGFEITNLYRRSRVPWKAAMGFEAKVIPPSSREMIVFDNAEAKGGTLAALNKGLVGHNSGLPDTYGFKAADLAALMAQWRERAVVSR